MPIRFLKPGFTGSIRLARVSYGARLLFVSLITLVDDYGRFEAHPLILARNAFPYGDPEGRYITEDQIEAWLKELETSRVYENDLPLLTRYEVDGVSYLALHRWTDRVRNVQPLYPDPPFPQEFNFADSHVEKSYRAWQKASTLIRLHRQQQLADFARWQQDLAVCSSMQQSAADKEKSAENDPSAAVRSNPLYPYPDPSPIQEQSKVLRKEIIKGSDPAGNGEGTQNHGEARPTPESSKAQWAALDSQVNRLNKLGENRTASQDATLKKVKKMRLLLTKKQGKGDWTAVHEEDVS